MLQYVWFYLEQLEEYLVSHRDTGAASNADMYRGHCLMTSTISFLLYVDIGQVQHLDITLEYLF